MVEVLVFSLHKDLTLELSSLMKAGTNDSFKRFDLNLGVQSLSPDGRGL